MGTTKDRPKTDFKGEGHRPSVTDVALQQVVVVIGRQKLLTAVGNNDTPAVIVIRDHS